MYGGSIPSLLWNWSGLGLWCFGRLWFGWLRRPTTFRRFSSRRSSRWPPYSVSLLASIISPLSCRPFLMLSLCALPFTLFMRPGFNRRRWRDGLRGWLRRCVGCWYGWCRRWYGCWSRPNFPAYPIRKCGYTGVVRHRVKY